MDHPYLPVPQRLQRSVQGDDQGDPLGGIQPSLPRSVRGSSTSRHESASRRGGVWHDTCIQGLSDRSPVIIADVLQCRTSNANPVCPVLTYPSRIIPNHIYLKR